MKPTERDSKITKAFTGNMLRQFCLPRKGAHGYEESPFRGAKICQRTFAAHPVNRKRRECPSRRFFVFPSLSCGLRDPKLGAYSLCSARVGFRIPIVPLPDALFRAKLSDSLVVGPRGVNTQFPFGVAEGTLVAEVDLLHRLSSEQTRK
jgi:hypothetical protein